jgi:Protein of unknown function (DUF3987)
MRQPTAIVRDRLGRPEPALPAPILDGDSAALRGLPGDVVRTLEPYTEADPAGLLLNTVTSFGAMVGQMAEVRVGMAHHPPALFVALIGRTSHSRKGTATAEVDGVMRLVEEGWHRDHQVSGFGSGEGFIEHAAMRPGSSIYLVETEFARMLAVASREGATISPVMRAAWDFRPMELRLRGKQYEADAAPVALMAHMTMGELHDSRFGLRPVQVVNGFGNRILWCFVDRRQLVDDPQPVPKHQLAPLTSRLRSALDSARRAGVVARSPDAVEMWADLYRGKLGSDEGFGVVDELTARAEAQLVRLSLVYALMDGSSAITAGHLESAWEVWRYCRWSAQHIFVGSGTGDRDIDRIVSILRSGEDLSGRDLDRMFYGRRSAEELRQRLVALGLGAERQGETTAKGGRPSILLTAMDKPGKPDKPPGEPLGAPLDELWWRTPDYRLRSSRGLSSSSGLSTGMAKGDGGNDRSPDLSE